MLVVHEPYGLDDNAREAAEQFASEGYVALAPELYSGSGRLPHDIGPYEEAGHAFMNEEGDPAWYMTS